MPYDNQVGGRAEIVSILGDHLLKPTKANEVKCYLRMPSAMEDIVPDCCFVVTYGDIIPLKKCAFCRNNTSMAAAIKSLLPSKFSGHFLVMKNATHLMAKPRVLDIKLGTRTHKPHISEGKKRKRSMKLQNTSSWRLGLRLCGASFYEENELVKWRREEGKKITAKMFVEVMNSFFDNVPQIQKDAVTMELLNIKSALEESKGVRVFGASLLLMVDDMSHVVKVKLIDFANMARSEKDQIQYEGEDNDALLGINTLLELVNL